MSERPLRLLFAESALLFRRVARSAAWVLAAGLVPATLVVAGALYATGLTSQKAVAEAIEAGAWQRGLVMGTAGLLKRLIETWAFAALVCLVEAERREAPLSAGEAYRQALGRLVPLALTAVNAAMRVFGGLLLLVVPGLLAAYRYCLAHLAVIVEGLQGAAALQRSRHLLHGRARQALVSLGAATLAAMAFDMLAAILLKGSTGAAVALGAAPVGPIEAQLELLLMQMASGMIGCWLTAFSLLLYWDLAENQASWPA
jgi:hypothetical protein